MAICTAHSQFGIVPVLRTRRGCRVEAGASPLMISQGAMLLGFRRTAHVRKPWQRRRLGQEVLPRRRCGYPPVNRLPRPVRGHRPLSLHHLALRVLEIQQCVGSFDLLNFCLGVLFDKLTYMEVSAPASVANVKPLTPF